MPSEKLFYADAYLRRFTATVVSCRLDRTGWHAILDRTAFYPEGGGQPGDTGVLSGVPVLDTREQDGQIEHLCPSELTPGTTVEGEIDWARRFDFMQQHSGEHILSGIIHQLYGFDNVGFHMGSDVVTVDVSGPLTDEALQRVERRANELIWEDVPISVSWPDAQALEVLSYRSKKALTGAVRIVTVPGADVCACCGTHVARTGAIGLIKLLSAQKFRSGMRLELVCGKRAFDYVDKVCRENHAVSNLLCAKALETAAAVARMQAENEALKYRLTGYENRIFASVAGSLPGEGNILYFEDGLSSDSLRKLCAAITEGRSGRVAVFSADGQGSYKYALGQTEGDLRAFAAAMNEALNGRGGGKPFFIQGSCACSRREIEAFFASADLPAGE